MNYTDNQNVTIKSKITFDNDHMKMDTIADPRFDLDHMKMNTIAEIRLDSDYMNMDKDGENQMIIEPCKKKSNEKPSKFLTIIYIRYELFLKYVTFQKFIMKIKTKIIYHFVKYVWS